MCIIFGAGTPPAQPPAIADKDLVIAADGGYTYALSEGIHADVLIGDFDSLDASAVEENGSGPLVVRLPKEKDRTDMLAALEYGLERGFRRLHIYGGAGGRIDHTLANVQCLAYLAGRGARGYLHDGDNIVTALRGGLRLAAREHGVISVFAYGGRAGGVCIRGLKYELENARITCDFPLGVSNEFAGRPVYIGAECGVLVVIYPAGTREIEEPPASED